MRLVPHFIVGSLNPIMLRMPGRRRHDEMMACLRDIRSEIAALRRGEQADRVQHRVDGGEFIVRMARVDDRIAALNRLSRRPAA